MLLTIMKTSFLSSLVLAASLVGSSAAPLGSAFTYQGRLTDGGQPAGGEYDFVFSLFDAAAGGNPVTGTLPLTNDNVLVTNGVFTTALDFGTNVFNGQGLWLEIAVRPGASTDAFTNITPRQAVTATPYALRALSFSGVLPGAQLAGVYGSAVNISNEASVFGGRFHGNGAGLTNVNAATLGGLGSSNFWRIGGNAGTLVANHFLGTTDNQPLELRVNNARAFRLQPDTSPQNAPNIIGGSPVNLLAPGIVGATIAGGGSADYEGNGPAPNTVGHSYGTVGGGVGNDTAGVGATIGGGYNNTAIGFFATVAGGGANLANGDPATVGGGLSNQATNTGSTVAGGNENVAGHVTASVGGGLQNLSSGVSSTVAGGAYNTNRGSFAALGGGMFNESLGNAAAVAGGTLNRASGNYSMIGGGRNNFATNTGSSLLGGGNNRAHGLYSTVGGGTNGLASGGYSTLAGGRDNRATNNYSTVSGGFQNESTGTAATVGGGFDNTASSSYTTVGGGVDNSATDTFATVGGGNFNRSSGQAATVSGGNSNLASDDYATVGGGLSNQATNTASTVAGGRYNHAYGLYSTVSGGTNGLASGNYSTVVGGRNNTASSDLSTAIGAFATASGYASMAIGGGTTASGDYSTAMGTSTTASGYLSTAMGYRANALHAGSYVWGDSQLADFSSTANNQFLIRASGGVGIGHNNPDAPLHVVGGADVSPTGGGVLILGSVSGGNIAMDGNEIMARNNGAASALFLNAAAGGNVSIGTTTSDSRLRVANATCDGFQWQNASDRNLKSGFAPVDARDVLAKVAALPLQSWHYTNAPGTRHVGPMAQDFHAAFGLGADDKLIATVDADGVALAAIQGLNSLVQTQAEELRALKAELAELRRAVNSGGSNTARH